MAISFYYKHYHLLDRWPVRMGENQYYFNQFKQPSVPDDQVGSSDPDLEHSTIGVRLRVWHQVDREPLAEALGGSFERVTELIGYFPQPTFIKNEIIKLDPKRPWWNQEITLPRRKLIRVGELNYNETDIEVDYAEIELLRKRQIPGYRVGICLPDDIDIDTIDIGELKDRFHLSLTGQETSYEVGVTDRDVLLLTQVNPFIREGNVGSILLPSLSLSCTSANEFQYLFNIPIWEMVSHDNMFSQLQHGAIDFPFEFSNDNWGDLTSPNANDDAIEFTEREINEEDAVQLLFRPTGANSSANLVKASVEATITDYENSKIWLKEKHLNINNVYEPPYAIKISYESGLAYQVDGNMNAQLEMAIIALANAGISVKLPVSEQASSLYDEHRTPIYDEKRNVKNPNFLNPLGDRIGHSRAWDLILPKADRIKGTAHYLRY